MCILQRKFHSVQHTEEWHHWYHENNRLKEFYLWFDARVGVCKPFLLQTKLFYFAKLQIKYRGRPLLWLDTVVCIVSREWAQMHNKHRITMEELG